jgi:hypothetical protein
MTESRQDGLYVETEIAPHIEITAQLCDEIRVAAMLSDTLAVDAQVSDALTLSAIQVAAEIEIDQQIDLANGELAVMMDMIGDKKEQRKQNVARLFFAMNA